MDAHGTPIEDLRRRARQFYYGRKSDYKRAKLTAKSRYVESRAGLARRRGDEAAARRYYATGLKYRRMLHDPGPALDDAVALAALERRQGRLDDAAEYLDEARQICAEVDPTREFLAEVAELASAYEDRGDDETATEWYFTQIYSARAADPDFEDRRAERHRRYLRQAEAPGTTPNVYDLALRNVLHGDDELAGECFVEAWSRRGAIKPGSQQHVLVLAAGAGLLAHDAVAGDVLTDDERETIREVLSEERDKLSEPATALFDALDGEAVDSSAFDADIDPRDIRANLGQLEEAAYVTLLERLDEE